LVKKQKPKSIRNPNAISSDPKTVNRLLQDLEWREQEREFEREYQRSLDGGLRSHSRYRAAGADNVAHPYNGGLPGLGKGQ